MSVDVASGTVYFDAVEVVVSSGTLSIDVSDPSNDRMDLIVVNSGGTKSVIKGTASSSPVPAPFDIDTYVILARVTVEDGSTAIVTANIKDMRTFFKTAVAGVEAFTDLTDVPSSYSGEAGNVVTVNGTEDGLEFTTASPYGVKKHTGYFTASTTNINIAHNLNTTSPIVMIYDSDDKAMLGDIEIVDANNVTLTLATVTTGKIEVHGGYQSSSPGAGTADFLPDTDVTWDLGSGSYKWKDIHCDTLHASSSSVYIGNTALTNNAGDLEWGGSPIGGSGTVHRKIFTDATERTVSSASLSDTATAFTLTAPVNSLVLAVIYEAEIKQSTSDWVRSTLKISGSNFGTKYLTGKYALYSSATGSIDNYEVCLNSTEVLTGSYPELITNLGSTYRPFIASLVTPFEILDASTTLTVRLAADSGTGYVQNVTVTVIYVESFTED